MKKVKGVCLLFALLMSCCALAQNGTFVVKKPFAEAVPTIDELDTLDYFGREMVAMANNSNTGVDDSVEMETLRPGLYRLAGEGYEVAYTKRCYIYVDEANKAWLYFTKYKERRMNKCLMYKPQKLTDVLSGSYGAYGNRSIRMQLAGMIEEAQNDIEVGIELKAKTSANGSYAFHIFMNEEKTFSGTIVAVRERRKR